MKILKLKLIDQFTLWFLIVTALVLLIGGGTCIYYCTKRNNTGRLQETQRHSNITG